MQELRIDDRDRAVLGGPEWVPLNRAALDDIEYDTLADWEQNELRGSITWVLGAELGKGSAFGIKAAVWLARKIEGIATPPFTAFNLRFPRQVRMRTVKAADAGPPPQGSSEPPSA